jgi:hypothetical protein
MRKYEKVDFLAKDKYVFSKKSKNFKKSVTFSFVSSHETRGTSNSLFAMANYGNLWQCLAKLRFQRKNALWQKANDLLADDVADDAGRGAGKVDYFYHVGVFCLFRQ